MKRAVSLTLVLILLLCFTASAAKVNVMTVTANNARLRAAANTSSGTIRLLKSGEHVFYLGSKGSYIKIHTSRGETGYVFRNYLKYHVTVNSERVFIASAGTRMYERPSTTSKCMLSMPAKNYVLVGAIRGGWAYIKTMTGKMGYIQAKNMRTMR